VAKKLLTVCGLSSVQAIAQHTPDRIERLFFDQQNARLFAATSSYLANRRKIYRLVTAEELKKITDTAHHQGVAAVIQEPVAHDVANLDLRSGTLCLHDVLNPHNVGAIVRTAAFFGITDLILSEQSFAAAMTASAWRVAEGGLTHCRLYTYSAVRGLFASAVKKQWFTAAAVRPDENVVADLRAVIRKGGNSVVLCLGNEEHGLPPEFVRNCRAVFTIPGSGKVESLNVSVTAALCLEKLAGHRKPANF
jgi:TrmH RNA methyltransferase